MAFRFLLIFFKKILLYFPLSFLQLFDKLHNKKNNIIPLKDRYGMYGFLGLAGSGKTISMVYSLYQARKKYKNNIYIITNFPCKLANYVMPIYKDKNGDFKTDYRALLRFYNKPVFVAWDEMQNDFKQSDFKDFPQDLFRRLTQLRKSNGMVLYYTTQDLKHIDINIRRLTFYFNECHTYKDRFTYFVQYNALYYNAKYESNSIDNKLKVPIEKVVSFFQVKYRKLYDSFRFV